MPWGRLDDSLYDHPKLDRLPADERLAAVGLWARAISWCNRFLTDGHVPRDRVAKLDGTTALAELLVAAGLFEDVPSGYAIHDFLAFNDSRAEVIARREKEAARKAAYRASKSGTKPRPGGTKPGTASVNGTDVPHGVPSGVPAGRTVGQGRDSRARTGGIRESRPDPSHSDSPQPPSRAGGRKNRANGTSPREVAKAEQAERDETARQRRWRTNQRLLAYSRGQITEAERDDMNRRDAPLEEIEKGPDWLAAGVAGGEG